MLFLILCPANFETFVPGETGSTSGTACQSYVRTLCYVVHSKGSSNRTAGYIRDLVKEADLMLYSKR